jgi:hypothetical protein
VWGAIESSLDRELLAPKLLRNVFVVLVSQWMDTRQQEECLSCHWWKNKLVIGGKFEGKDWHDRRSTKYFEIKNFEIFSIEFSSHNSKWHVVIHYQTSEYH